MSYIKCKNCIYCDTINLICRPPYKKGKLEYTLDKEDLEKPDKCDYYMARPIEKKIELTIKIPEEMYNDIKKGYTCQEYADEIMKLIMEKLGCTNGEFKNGRERKN